ncbi:calcium calmodulin-dependent protein kinase [Curvularia clavata]|uniref:Calcium calmodulin-dependent protein kinase n=1 Tax=Curvularia clavata TaxID=95742 RepID=A0A9Q8Z7L4_CURCL|nr:calcium calmodulin-dependent protein kinase [Curvularia clavata]
MGSISPQPGVLLVHPLLRSPNDSNAETFHRWTKLHNKDLLNIPKDASSGANIDACVRGVALNGATDYSHEEKPDKWPAYMYTCFVGDIGVLKNQPYYNVSRKLNLEQTRSLAEDEKPVGYGDKNAMVFDIVNAKFAVYKEIERPYMYFSDLRSELACAKFSGASSETITRINLCTPYGWDLQSAKLLAHYLETSLQRSKLETMTGMSLTLYRWAGRESQPDKHPLIDVQGISEWMILVIIRCSPPYRFEKLIPITMDIIGTSLQAFALDTIGSEVKGMFNYGVWGAEGYNRVPIDKEEL